MHLSEGMQKLVIFFIWQLLNFTDTVMLRMMLRAIFNPIRQQRRLQPQFLPGRRSNNGFSQLRVFISGRCLLCPSEQTLSDQTSGRRRLRHDHKRPMMSSLNYTKQGTTFCIIRVPPKSKNEKQNEENEGQTSLQTSFQPHKISLHDGNGGGLT